MIGNEPFLKSCLVMALEGVQVRFAAWKHKQMILTEQSIYFFNKNEDISASEAVVMKLADTEAVYKGTKPSYRKYSFRFHPHRKLPICLDPFIYFVELRVKQKDSNSVHKRRILVLNSKTIAKDWVKLIKLQNLSSIYASSTSQSNKTGVMNPFNQNPMHMYGQNSADSNIRTMISSLVDGTAELKPSLMDDRIYPELQDLIADSRIKVPNIYCDAEKFEKIIELAGANIHIKNEVTKGKFAWDSEFSKKSINVQNMLDELFDNSAHKGSKKLKTLLSNHLTKSPHKARFVFQEIDVKDINPNEKDIIGKIDIAEPEKDENSELNDTNCTEFYYQNVIHKNPGLLTIEQLQNAMDRNDLFSLDMLCKLFERVGFELPQYVQPKLWQLKNEANYVTTNLMKVINMETENDNELNDILDICLSKAKNINMRGDLIDACIAIKIFRDKITDQMEEGVNNPEKDQEEEFVKLFKDDNFLDNIQYSSQHDESDSSFTYSVIDKPLPQKGVVTCNVCKNHIDLATVNYEGKGSLRDSKASDKPDKFGGIKVNSVRVPRKMTSNSALGLNKSMMRYPESATSHDSETEHRLMKDLSRKFLKNTESYRDQNNKTQTHKLQVQNRYKQPQAVSQNSISESNVDEKSNESPFFPAKGEKLLSSPVHTHESRTPVPNTHEPEDFGQELALHQNIESEANKDLHKNEESKGEQEMSFINLFKQKEKNTESVLNVKLSSKILTQEMGHSTSKDEDDNSSKQKAPDPTPAEGDKEDNNLTQEQELEKEDVQEQPQLYVHTQKIPQESDQEHAQEVLTAPMVSLKIPTKKPEISSTLTNDDQEDSNSGFDITTRDNPEKALLTKQRLMAMMHNAARGAVDAGNGVKVAGKRIGFGQIGQSYQLNQKELKHDLKKKLDKAFDACPSDSDEDDEDDYDN